MASGDTLLYFDALNGIPTATIGATLDQRAGGSTPSEQFMVWAFNAASDSFVDFRAVMPQAYSGGGITCRIIWGAFSAGAGDVVWNIAFRSIEDDAEDIDASHTYTVNAVTDTAPSTAGEYTAASITFTDGADMDNVDAGDPFILRISRDANNGSDTMGGNAELVGIEIRET
jgi:hypothetical protein